MNIVVIITISRYVSIVTPCRSEQGEKSRHCYGGSVSEGSEDDVRISRPEELKSARSGGPGVLDSLKLLAAESSATRSSAIILGLKAIVACLPGASKTIFILPPVNQSIVIGGTQNDSCLPHCMLHSPAVCLYVRLRQTWIWVAADIDTDMGMDTASSGYGYRHNE